MVQVRLGRGHGIKSSKRHEPRVQGIVKKPANYRNISELFVLSLSPTAARLASHAPTTSNCSGVGSGSRRSTSPSSGPNAGATNATAPCGGRPTPPVAVECH